MHWNGYGNDMWDWVFMAFWMLIIILAIIMIVRYVVLSGQRIEPSEDALEILKKRYAKGEINKKEFDEMKRTLS